MKRIQEELNDSKRRRLSIVDPLEILRFVAQWLAENNQTSSNLLLTCKSIYGAAKLKTNRLDVTVENLPWMLSLGADRYDLALYAARAGNLTYLEHVLPECGNKFSKLFRDELIENAFRSDSKQLVEYCAAQFKLTIDTIATSAFKWDRLDIILDVANQNPVCGRIMSRDRLVVVLCENWYALNGPKITKWIILTQIFDEFEVFQDKMKTIFCSILRRAIRFNNIRIVNLLKNLGKCTQDDFENCATEAFFHDCKDYIRFLVDNRYSLETKSLDFCTHLPFLMYYLDNFGTLDSILSKKPLLSYEVADWISSKRPLHLNWSKFIRICRCQKFDDWKNLYHRCVLQPLKKLIHLDFDSTLFDWLKTVSINWNYLIIRGDIPSDFLQWLLTNTSVTFCPNNIKLERSIEIAKTHPQRLQPFEDYGMSDEGIETLLDEDWNFLFENVISKRKLLKQFITFRSFAGAKFIMDKFAIPFAKRVRFFSPEDVKLWHTWFPNQLETKKISYSFGPELLTCFTSAEIESMDQSVYSKSVKHLNQTEYLNLIRKRPD